MIPILLIVIVLVLVVAYMGSRYKVAGANEALIVSGRRERGAEGQVGLKVVRGQGVIVLPLINKVGRLHLSARQINVQLSDAVTKQGIKVAVQGVATVKIGSDEESIRAAAERFLEREDQIDSIVKNVLEGSLRSIVGTLTVEELNYDRAKFQQEVQSAARSDLATSGLTIDNFTIQAIRDEVGYMDLIGQQETARRERDARMAKATADQEAAVREAESQQIKLNAAAGRLAPPGGGRGADRRRPTRRPPSPARSPRPRRPRRSSAGRPSSRSSRPTGSRRSSSRRRSGPPRPTRTPRSSAPRARSSSRIAAAQADAERVQLAGQAEAAIQVMKGEANARVTEVNAEATAKQTTLEGNAEAGIVLSKGEAEAKALALRAEAYRQFNEAAVIQTVLSMLPEIVRAAAEPMGRIDQLTVLSNDGASELVKNTTRTVTEASATVKGLTGIDVPGADRPARWARRFGGNGAPKPTGSGPSGGRRQRAAAAPAAASAPGRPSARTRSRAAGDPAGGAQPADRAPAAIEAGPTSAARAEAESPRPMTPPSRRSTGRPIGAPRGGRSRDRPADADAAAATAGRRRPRPATPPAVGDARPRVDARRGRAGARRRPDADPGHPALRRHAPGRPRAVRPAPAAHDVARSRATSSSASTAS